MNITKKKKLLTKEFFNILSQMNPLFEKTINKTKEDWNEREENDFEELLSYYKNIRGTSLKDMAEAYELIVNMMREETYFFRRNGRYRNSTLKDVEECVYKNEDYMTKYMLGLAISDYLWIQHIKMVRFYESHMNMFTGNYLEIGPGHGQYLARSIQKGHFSKIEAIDISPVSVDSSNEYLRYKNLSDKCQVKNMDFFEYDSVDTKFDTIVMSEVLEHVENPLNMLLKIKNLLSPNLCVGGAKRMFLQL